MNQTQLDENTHSNDTAQRILRDFGYFGHYLHLNTGGRSGKGHILIKIYKAGGSISQKELQESCTISSASLSEALAKLEREELVERSRKDADKRQMSLELTELGRTRAEQIIKEKSSFEKRAFGCLDTHEQAQLLELLDRVRTSWEQSSCDEEVGA